MTALVGFTLGGVLGLILGFAIALLWLDHRDDGLDGPDDRKER